MGLREQKEVGVYAHIPYCLRKCPYCDFASEAAPAPEKRYAAALIKELAAAVTRDGLEGRGCATIYLGGGTPSLFSPGSIEIITSSILKCLRPAADIEITLEANPGAAEAGRFAGFRKAGVNRLSIGVQSLDDTVLSTLGRVHAAKDAVHALTLAREAGFKNIGADLIFGVPGQGLDSWKDTLKRLADLRPEHVSLYGLTIEPGTPFHPLYNDKARHVAEELELKMYLHAIGFLKGLGYRHYEISNFALPGFESRHNTNYWLGRDYMGLGAGAHSYLSRPGYGTRRWNERGASAYMDCVEGRGEAVAGSEELTREGAMAESVLLGLRMLYRGIEAAPFAERFGIFPAEALPAVLSLQSEGLVEVRGGNILLTEKGLPVADYVALRLSESI